MPIKNNIEIIKVEEINPTILQLSFNLEWTMDDKVAIIDHVLLSASAKVLEVLQGADLYCLRIKYSDYEFLLNFEEYSHACWLECITAQDRTGLQEIKLLLSSGS
ncbi:DUF3630 family protein [Colwellia sp. MB3u-70]|uniref:DUF3630 family protein n=1 Tax=unclassified Colwellia TaxID=196834 RepID=UPI0015F36C4B|nr:MULTISPECIES: DUF3630 family protein [unclassified Colwellia]MBA6294209.1 DUF3630 family protein [Colwellia sp. MB3u-8]MBA6307750.1 DUF3630 family protein [Colwellia sp. MB3u-70]